MVELSDGDALGANELEIVIVKEAVCEGDEAPVATTIDKEDVVVDEKVPETEAESENEFVS